MNDIMIFAMSGTGQDGGDGGMGMITMVLIFAIIYFLMIRPQSKKAKNQKSMISALVKGDKVVSIGGIHGEITNVKDSTFVIKVQSGAEIEMSRDSIAAKVAAE